MDTTKEGIGKKSERGVNVPGAGPRTGRFKFFRAFRAERTLATTEESSVVGGKADGGTKRSGLAEGLDNVRADDVFSGYADAQRA